MIPHYPPNPLWNIDPAAALAEVERRIRATGKTYIATGHFQALDRLPANLADTTDDQLYLASTRVSDISKLRDLPNLRSLSLSKHVTDISPLAALNKLERLDLFFSPVTDISALTACSSLQGITNLRSNVDLEPLGRITTLKTLSLCVFKDQRVPHMPSLTHFMVQGSAEQELDLDLSFLSASPHLDMISGSQMRGFNPPIRLDALTKFSMCLSNTEDFGTVAAYPMLRTLAVRDTDIDSLRAIPLNSVLEEINLSGTKIRDIERLSKLVQLKEVVVDDTPLKDIAPLSYNNRIERISAAGTKIVLLIGWNPNARLDSLNIDNTGFCDLQPLVGTYLISLSACNTPLSDLTGLSKINRLSRLYINDSKVAHIPSSESHAAVLNIREEDVYDQREGRRFDFRRTPLATSGYRSRVINPRRSPKKSFWTWLTSW